MYKILVVDDEPIIVESIGDLLKNIKNYELDIQVAYSGTEALQILNNNKINIVLTDINMPKLDGFSLQKEIVERYPDCRIVFITGYDEFNMIQDAMRNKLVDYVLKSEGEEAIINAVIKAIDEIEEEKSNRYMIIKAKEHMDKAMPYIQKEFIGEMLSGWNGSGRDLSEKFSAMEITMSENQPVIMIVGRVDSFHYRKSYTDKLKLMVAIQDILIQTLGEKMDCISIIHQQYRMIWLLQAKDALTGNTKTTIQEICEILDFVQDKCDVLFEVSTSFVLCDTFVDWENISVVYNFIDYKMNYSYKFAEKVVLVFNIEKTSDIAKYKMMDFQKLRSGSEKIEFLKTYLEFGQDTKFYETLEEINKSVAVISENYAYKNEIFYSIVSMYLSYINYTDIAGKLAKKIDLDKLMHINLQTSWEDITLYFKQIAGCIFELEREHDADNEKEVIYKIQEYITNNIGTDISLTQLSEIFHFNASYLSRLYKTLTGENISQYINRIKLEKAKEMLSDGKYKINEIAAAIGFKTPSYFTYFFKKNLDMTPHQYRHGSNTYNL